MGAGGTGGTLMINGGSIKANSIRNPPKNEANTPVYCVTVKVEGLKVERLKIEVRHEVRPCVSFRSRRHSMECRGEMPRGQLIEAAIKQIDVDNTIRYW